MLCLKISWIEITKPIINCKITAYNNIQLIKNSFNESMCEETHNLWPISISISKFLITEINMTFFPKSIKQTKNYSNYKFHIHIVVVPSHYKIICDYHNCLTSIVLPLSVARFSSQSCVTDIKLVQVAKCSPSCVPRIVFPVALFPLPVFPTMKNLYTSAKK